MDNFRFTVGDTVRSIRKVGWVEAYPELMTIVDISEDNYILANTDKADGRRFVIPAIFAETKFDKVVPPKERMTYGEDAELLKLFEKAGFNIDDLENGTMGGLRIALYGEPGCGKDYVSNVLVDTYGFERFAFADELRHFCQSYFPGLWKPRGKNRELLQTVGTKMREIDPLVWIRAAHKSMAHSNECNMEVHNCKTNIVITDLRMPNEYFYLKAMGFTIIHVYAPSHARIDRLNRRDGVDDVCNQNMNHDSESHYDKFEADFLLNNTWDILHPEHNNMVITQLRAIHTMLTHWKRGNRISRGKKINISDSPADS